MIFRRKYNASRRAAWLAVFAILLQTIVPALHHPAGMAFGGAPTLSYAEHLCVAPGSTPVAPTDPDKGAHHHLPACAICQAVHAIGGFASPDAPSIALAGEFGRFLPVARTELLFPQRAGDFAQPRGPPVST
jgi:hypothetical protein